MSGLWTPFSQVLEQVRGWPGVDDAALRAAVQRAEEEGLFQWYRGVESFQPLWGLVITPTFASLPETIRYAFQRINGVWAPSFSGGRLGIEMRMGRRPDLVRFVGEEPFSPNGLSVDLVDFGCLGGTSLQTVEEEQLLCGHFLAGLQVLYAACQHPTWVRAFGTRDSPVPSPLATGILLGSLGEEDQPCTLHLRVNYLGHLCVDLFSCARYLGAGICTPLRVLPP